LFSFMSLAEELEDVGTGDFTLVDALMVVLLTTPRRIVELLPITALLGGLLGLGTMANHLELMAIRTSGFSKRRIAMTVTMLAILMCLFVTAMQFAAVPEAEREAIQLRAKSLLNSESNRDTFWTRNGNSIIRINEVVYDRTLAGIEIHTTDERGRLSMLTQAKSADFTGQENWLLKDVIQSEIRDTQLVETHYERKIWKGLLSAEQASVLVLPLEALAPTDLLRIISNLKENQLDTQTYEIVFWQQVSLLPGLLAMTLLSLPFLLGSVRSVSASQRVMIGGLIGITFYLVQKLGGNMAGIFGLNPPLVILTPPFILLFVAIGMIGRKEF
jgi:lipopolysaccharide export system permease protein